MTVTPWGNFYGYQRNEFGSLSRIPYWNYNKNYCALIYYYAVLGKTYVGIHVGSSDYPRTLYVNGTIFNYYGTTDEDDLGLVALFTYSGVALNLINMKNSQLNLTFSPAPTGYC